MCIRDRCRREVNWYMTMSRNINDIEGDPPTGWKSCASPDGFINSNYGWCVFGSENHHQFAEVVTELTHNPESRRAVCIYTRPTMWREYDRDGMNDFMCTNTVQYLIRDNRLHAVVNMRSSDAVWGYKGDRYWQAYVQARLHEVLVAVYPELLIGDVIWNAGSLHVYERHWWLLDCYARFGHFMTRKEYDDVV